MPTVAERIAALHRLDENARQAVEISCQIWEAKWRQEAMRAAKAEYLLDCVQKWAADWGLIFDIEKQAATWDAVFDHRADLLLTWFELQVKLTGRQIEQLERELAVAVERAKRAETRAEKAERLLHEVRRDHHV